MELQELKQKIQGLIDKATADNERQKKVLKFLFDKIREVNELETIDRLRQFAGGAKYLNAYLLYKSIVRSNYQVELTKHADYGEEQGQDKLLNAIGADIENWEEQNKDKVPIENKEPANETLLMWLSERIGKGEIKRELTDFGNYLMTEGKQGLLKVDLHDGKLTPNPAEELLKKHGLFEDKEAKTLTSDKAEVKFPFGNSVPIIEKTTLFPTT